MASVLVVVPMTVLVVDKAAVTEGTMAPVEVDNTTLEPGGGGGGFETLTPVTDALATSEAAPVALVTMAAVVLDEARLVVVIEPIAVVLSEPKPDPESTELHPVSRLRRRAIILA